MDTLRTAVKAILGSAALYKEVWDGFDEKSTPRNSIIIPGGRFISSLGKLKGGRFIWLHVLGGGGRFISAQRHQKLSTANFLCFFERQIGRKNRKIETPLLSELSRSSLDSCELEGKVDQIQGRSA